MDPSEPPTEHPPLSTLQLSILDFEAQKPLWTSAGAREASIRAELGLSARRYHQVLDHLLDHPAAAAYAPQTVHRLRGERARRRDRRSPWRTVRGARGRAASSD